ncbi:hypothetical protein PLICRDRAFT_53303 [Plicaturopsis crispa FD-325 SS-3]|nr:hypothetical protein PLICRDRAFT_53303 [Plicaturopsis crispa FD-325 SS-3]
MVKVELILGPVVTAVVTNAFLYGLCVLQFSTFYTSGLKNRPIMKILVGWVLLLDTYHTMSAVYLLWDYVVTNFNNPDILTKSPWPFPSTPIVTAGASIPIQHYLAWRIKQFSGSWLIFGIISFLSIVQGAFAVVSAVLALKTTSITDFDKIIPFVDTWLTLTIACDMSITALLAYHLRKSRTGFRRTDNVITGVIRSSVETAAFAFFFCVMDFICFTILELQDTNFHLIFALPMGRIYTNTLLTTLNSRAHLRHELHGIRDTTFAFMTMDSGVPRLMNTIDPNRLNTEPALLTVRKDAHTVVYDDAGCPVSDGDTRDRKVDLDLAPYPEQQAPSSREVGPAAV